MTSFLVIKTFVILSKIVKLLFDFVKFYFSELLGRINLYIYSLCQQFLL